ncbi:DsbA family protein [Panacagrimonas sp.]|uniref:thiol:disulfide interchange protein DsbA/DsbL n=1 Tax=Panacagrimonas sp. TaxID=2480088 RepID=UPI003B523AD3
MTRVMKAFVASLALLTFACSADDSDAKFKDGKQYKQVKKVAQPADPKRIAVEEFFWYGCQHCYHFEGTIEAWAASKPADVDFIRVPASLGRPEGKAHQQAFYTAEVLNVTDKIHTPLFQGIHDQRRNLFTQETLRAFFNQQSGVLPDVFDSTYTGFAVNSRVGKAEQLARDYLILSVPTVVVGGKYQTNSNMAGDFPKVAEVVNFLVEKVRKERQR